MRSQKNKWLWALKVMTEQIFFCTVEPRQYNEGLKGLEKFVRYNEVLLSRFFFIYFTITGVKKIIRYTEDFISRFHCKRKQIKNVVVLILINDCRFLQLHKPKKDRDKQKAGKSQDINGWIC